MRARLAVSGCATCKLNWTLVGLYLDRGWTGVGQTLDRDWICVQKLPNQPDLRSTRSFVVISSLQKFALPLNSIHERTLIGGGAAYIISRMLGEPIIPFGPPIEDNGVISSSEQFAIAAT